jgi:hypothetical protein
MIIMNNPANVQSSPQMAAKLSGIIFKSSTGFIFSLQNEHQLDAADAVPMAIGKVIM